MDKKQAAQNVYDQLRGFLAGQNIKYDCKDDEKNIWFAVRGDDLRILIDITVDEKNQMVRVLSPLEFKIPQELREDVAIVINHLNFIIVNGCIDYDFESGSLLFRINARFKDSILGDGTLYNLIGAAVNTVEAFNDKLYMIANGVMTTQQYLNQLLSE